MDEAKHLGETAQQNPAFASEYSNKGKMLRERGRYKEALAAFEQAILLDSSSALAYSGRGAVLASLRCYEEALAAFEQAIRLDPMYVRGYTNKASVLLRLKRYGEAADALGRALQLDPTNRDIQRYLSRVNRYRVNRLYGELWRLYYAIIILASGFTIAWLGLRESLLFAVGIALLTIAAALIMLFKTFRG